MPSGASSAPASGGASTVAYVEDGETLVGTGGALRRALDAGALDPAFFVLYGDSYLPIDYRAVWDAFTAARDARAAHRVSQRWSVGHEQRALRERSGGALRQAT